jgi:biotin operon repressor
VKIDAFSSAADDVHRDSDDVNAVDVIDLDEETVRDYLNSLEHPVPPWVFDPVEVTKGIDDPIDKLRALAHARRHSEVNELEVDFVDAVVRWAAKNGITRDAFADLGVPARVLERAFGIASPRRGDRASTHASIGRLIAGICSKPAGTTMTVAGICDELGGSGTTVRKVLKKLTRQGVVIDRGPDRDYSGPGRPPVLFERRAVEPANVMAFQRPSTHVL